MASKQLKLHFNLPVPSAKKGSWSPDWAFEPQGSLRAFGSDWLVVIAVFDAPSVIARRQDNGWKRHHSQILGVARFSERGCPSFRNPFGFRIPFSCPAAAGELRSSCKLNRQDSPGLRPLTVVAALRSLRHPSLCCFRVRHALVSGTSCRPLGHFCPSNSTPFQSAFGISVKFIRQSSLMLRRAPRAPE